MTGGASPRQRGDYFEYQTRDDLVARGYIVARSAGSRGTFDLVALRNGKRPLLISCKVSGTISPGQRNALLLSATAAGARAILAHRPRRGAVAYAVVTPIRQTVSVDLADDDAGTADTSA